MSLERSRPSTSAPAMATEVDPSATAEDTAWTKLCPHCQAKVQAVARGCWNCGALISDADTEKPDYRPPLVDPDAASGVSIAILIAIIFFVPVVLVLWALVSMLNW